MAAEKPRTVTSSAYGLQIGGGFPRHLVHQRHNRGRARWSESTAPGRPREDNGLTRRYDVPPLAICLQPSRCMSTLNSLSKKIQPHMCNSFEAIPNIHDTVDKSTRKS
jgi:hypothetical protein